MNINPAVNNHGFVAFDGTTSYPHSIAGVVGFGFTFEIVADIVTAAVFAVEAAPPSDTNPCLPGAFVPVNQVSTCSIPSRTDEPALVTFPAGIKAGQVCIGTLPCTPDKFIRLVAKSGDTAKVKAVLVKTGLGR